MVTKPFVFLILIVVSLLTPVADIYIRQASRGDTVRNMLIAGSMWGVFLVGWFFVYKYLKFASTGIIYSLIYLIIAVGVGLFFFHEKLVMSEVIGVILAILAIILLGKYA